MQRHPELYGTTPAPRGHVSAVAGFEPVDAVYLAWWPGEFDDLYREVVAAVLRHGHAKPTILHHGATEKRAIKVHLDPVDPGRLVSYLDVASLGAYHRGSSAPAGQKTSPRTDPAARAVQSAWIRDWGPFFVRLTGGRRGIVDPVYRAERVNDDAVPTKLARHLRLPAFRPPLEVDGGNLLSDGRGTCFSALAGEDEIRASHDPAYQRILSRFFGCHHLIRLEPLSGERTGHVDVFLNVAPQNTLLLGSYPWDADAANADILDRNAATLGQAKDASGRPYRVLRVPMPDNYDGVYRTYLNAVVVNNLVMVPTYANTRREELRALAMFRRAYPGRRVVPILSDDIMEQGGALHCATRTRPAPMPPDPNGIGIRRPNQGSGGGSSCRSSSSCGLGGSGSPISPR